MRNIIYTTSLVLLLATAASAQNPIGIGTTTPDAHAALDITSTQKGVLLPRLTSTQQTTLAGMLTSSENGMIIIDAATGNPLVWSSGAFKTVEANTQPSAAAPITLTANNFKINPGTNAGDLLTWDGTNWVNAQPAVQHFTATVDNRQPFLVCNYVIGMEGIFPTQSDASTPYLGEIYLMACNFAPIGFHFCDGSLQSIAQNSALFQLIGTTYGGDGANTFALPDLRGRIPVHLGSNGQDSYFQGQLFGTENKTFTH
jgi:microcystin-dependent protein